MLLSINKLHSPMSVVPKVVDIDPQGSIGPSNGSINSYGVKWGHWTARGSMNNCWGLQKSLRTTDLCEEVDHVNTIFRTGPSAMHVVLEGDHFGHPWLRSIWKCNVFHPSPSCNTWHLKIFLQIFRNAVCGHIFPFLYRTLHRSTVDPLIGVWGALVMAL